MFRDQWKGHAAPYHPIFMDGWSPDYQITDEPDSIVEPKATRGEMHGEEQYDYYEYVHFLLTKALNVLYNF